MADRETWMFAVSWSLRWYQAAMGADATWLVLVAWIGVWCWKQRKRRRERNEHR